MYKYDSPVMIFGIIILIIALIGAAAGATLEQAGGEEGPDQVLIEKRLTETDSRTTNEGDSYDKELSLEYPEIIYINATLTWTDEAPGSTVDLGKTNTPDTFHLSIETPSGTTDEGSPSSNPVNGEGQATLNHEVAEEDLAEGNPIWIVTVHCDSCGDTEGVGGFRTWPDDSNAWSISIEIVYLDYEETE